MSSQKSLATTEGKNIMSQYSANYHPSLWGHHFISFSCDYQTLDAWEREAANLKERVREKFMKLSETKAGLGEQLKMIDAIQRLGISYHFEEEIEQILNQIFIHSDHHDDHEAAAAVDDDNLLHISALRFRMLREHGYNASSDVFTKFKDGKNGIKNGFIVKDVQDLLSLYEASYLSVHGEDILDKARTFTTIKLQEMVPHLKPCLAKQVLHALSRPMRKALPRLYAWEFMPFYKEDESHDEDLLKFAKLDFNILQKQHQYELSIISRWWKNLEVEVNFPFARDRLVECYFWILGVYYEPQYALARKFLTKVISMTSILDDLFDNVYGIHAELEHFTRAIQRWDINAMEELPKYMRIWYEALLELYDEMEKELAKTGRSFAIHYAKDAMIETVEAYHRESKWILRNNIPTIDEYMKIALDTTGYPMLIVASFAGMGEIATKQAFDWSRSRPRMLQAAFLISRLMDDIVSHQFEQQREHIPSAVECYMYQNGVSVEKARSELNNQVDIAWKDINESFLDCQSPPKPILTRVLNFARVMDVLYKEGDGYTDSTKTKHFLVSLLIDPLEI